MLSVSHIVKRFGTTQALRGASFTVHPNELLGLIGPNGSGKSTLLECLAGLIVADAGEVRVHHAPLTAEARRATLFYVPDGALPWPDQTVSWVTSFSATLQQTHLPISEQMYITRALGVEPLGNRRVGTLSKGERKRVLLALALLTPQPIVLIDEPFDGLDLRQMRDVGVLFRRVVDEGRTLLLSIHQLSDAARICDRLVLLSDGCVVGEGTLDELRARAGLPEGGLDEVFLALT